MNAKHGLTLKFIPTWAFVALLFVAILLAAVLLKVLTPFSPADPELAQLSFVSGDVRVSDGITEVKTNANTSIIGNTRTLLKTGIGYAILKMKNDSIIVLDANSTLEFNRENENNTGKFYPFNLVVGRALVINGQGSKSPTQIFIGGDNTIRVDQAVTGLEVQVDGGVHERVDCLVGKCLLNGAYLLLTGQSAQFGTGGTHQISSNISYEAWLSLTQVGEPNPPLSGLLANVLPTPTQVSSPAPLPGQTKPALPVTGDNTLPPTPNSTVTSLPTATITPSLTATRVPLHQPTHTPTPVYSWHPTSIPWTSTPVAPPATPTPSRTLQIKPTLTHTPTPTKTQLSTAIRTPKPTLTPTPTETPTLTPTPTPTFTPTPTPTQTPTPTPTPTDEPTRTPTPTNTPTDMPTPTPTPPPTNTPTEPPTPTPTPPPTNTPTEPPPPADTPTDSPPPVDTPVVAVMVKPICL